MLERQLLLFIIIINIIIIEKFSPGSGSEPRISSSSELLLAPPIQSLGSANDPSHSIGYLSEG
jgi:hypothetical protein